MAYEYHCEAYWPQKTNARSAPTDTGAVGRWLTQMDAAGWEFLTAVYAGDGVRGAEVLHYFRRAVGAS